MLLTVSTTPEWQTLALYAGVGAALLILLFNLPFIGRIIRALVSFGLLALTLFLLLQQAPFEPTLARLASGIGLDDQRVAGNTVRIPIARDGHFWARVSLNGVERRMLIDSGATITALSQRTAERAAITAQDRMLPVIMQTANGAVRVRTGTVDRLVVGSIEARNLKAVISPALGDIDVLGMNFLSQLESWRVENGTLILRPHPRDRGDRRTSRPQ